MEDFKTLLSAEIRAVRENTDAIKAAIAGQLEINKTLISGQKDHETRLRRLEYSVALAAGAVGVFKFLLGS